MTKSTEEIMVKLIRKELELDDEVKFNLSKSSHNPFHFDKGELFDYYCNCRSMSDLFALGDIEVIQDNKKAVLTKEEKEYLRINIKYSKLEVDTIRVKTSVFGKFVELCGLCEDETLPCTSLSFRMLEPGENYTLEELGLL